MDQNTPVKHLPREQNYSYDIIVKEPALTVRPGETFTVDTEDALNGLIHTEADLPVMGVLDERHTRRQGNPCAGPIVVEGARKGDVLVVNIHDIVVADQGFSCIFPGEGPLGDSYRYPDCRGPHTTVFKHRPGPSGTTSDGVGGFGRFTWNLRPFIGTLAIAPERPVAAGSDTVKGQGPHGGNLDCREFCKGNRIFFPVESDGAYLYVGDVHASQADAEWYGSANEARARLTLSCDLIPQKPIPWLRIETPESIIALHSSKPLEAAVTQSFMYLIDWLVTDYGFTAREAYVHLCTNPDVRINVYQMCELGRLQYVAGVAFPKSSLG